MRIIDADKLVEICRKGWKLFGREDEKLKHWVDEDDIRNQPTVNAIPITWLRDFQHSLYEEAEKISKEKDKNPMDTLGETWQFLSMSQAIDFTINKYGVENNLDKEIYGSEYIKMWEENES